MTIDAAQKLGRRWIGIDITHLAINLIRHRLLDTYGEEIKETYVVVGEPTSVPDARILAEQDPYQFQWWALGLVGARPVDQKKGADKGIDGRLYFHDEGPGGKTKQVIFSVKAGNTSVAHVRDLCHVVDREAGDFGSRLRAGADGCADLDARDYEADACGGALMAFAKGKPPLSLAGALCQSAGYGVV